MKSLEKQGLKAIEMLKEMRTMLDDQVSYDFNGLAPSEQFKKSKRDEQRKDTFIKDIHEKNEKIRNVLNGINGGGESSKGFNQLLELEAIFNPLSV